MKLLLLLLATTFVFSSADLTDNYKCIPCGRDCDKTIYNELGNCSDCRMPLVKAATIRFLHIEPDNICAYIKQKPETILLDVRTKAEFEGKAERNYGSLENAINIPIQELEKRISELAPFRDKEIIVYCSHSHRSPQASYILTQNGFNNIVNMDGGMSQLKDVACKRKD